MISNLGAAIRDLRETNASLNARNKKLRAELDLQQNRGATLHEALGGMRETIRRLEDTIEKLRGTA